MGVFGNVIRRFVQGRETVGDQFVIEPLASAIDSGPVTIEQARGLPGIGRGARLIADVASQLDLVAERNTDNPARIAERVYPTPRILTDPDPGVTPGTAWKWAAVDSLVWWGNTMAVPRGLNSEMRPSRLSMLDFRNCRWDSVDGYWEVQTARDPIRLRPSEVMHMRVHAPAGERLGQGLLDLYQEELRVMLAAERAQYVLLEHGVPTGLIKLDANSPATPADAETLKARWLASQRSRSVAVMKGADFQRVSFNADELSMIPTREFNLRLASDITGVPPYMLGVPSESRVYANAETEWANFLRVTLMPYLVTIEEALSQQLPSKGMWNQRAQFDLAPLMRGDAKTRWEVYKIGRELDALSRDEIRNLEGLGPMEGNPQ